MLLDVAGVDRPRAFPADVQHRIVHIFGEDEGQRLEPLNDLVHVFQHALHGLVLVHHTVQAEAPDRAAAERREQQPAERVAEGVAEPALQRLETEFGGIRIVVPLRHLDEVGTHEPGQVDGHGHFE
jgi:hypothetical protein